MDLSAIADYVLSADTTFMIVVGTTLVGITALYFGSTAIYVEYRKLRIRCAYMNNYYQITYVNMMVVLSRVARLHIH